MDQVRRRRSLALALAVVLTAVVRMVGPHLTSEAPLLGASLLGLAQLAAIGCVAYAACSFALEHLLDAQRDLDSLSVRRAEQRRGRHVQRPAVREAVLDGVGTARELADVLDVYEHVAHRMLERMVAEGELALADGRVVVPARREEPRSLATGPRWIDPQG